MQTIYSDGLANISLVDGVIRMDLLATTAVEGDKRGFRTVGTVAMSLPALLRAHDQLGKAIDKMVQEGILKKREPSEEQAEVQP